MPEHRRGQEPGLGSVTGALTHRAKRREWRAGVVAVGVLVEHQPSTAVPRVQVAAVVVDHDVDPAVVKQVSRGERAEHRAPVLAAHGLIATLATVQRDRDGVYWPSSDLPTVRAKRMDEPVGGGDY